MSLRGGFYLSLLVLMLVAALPVVAQDPSPTSPAPTLVPPTLVPTSAAEAAQLANVSGINTLQSEGKIRIGTRYNVFPFAFLDENGILRGYEVDLIQAIAVELGVEIEWVQLTGENQVEELAAGAVDVLIGEQAVTRATEQFTEFTHPYYLNKQMMVVKEESSAQDFNGLAGQTVGVVQSSPSDTALSEYPNAGWTVQYFFTDKDALDALDRDEIAGMAGELDDLSRAGRQGMRFLGQPLRLDPYAIAVRPYDVNLRNLLNRALQRLFASGRLEDIYKQWFSDDLDFDVLVPVYENVFDDPRTFYEFNPDLPIPESSIVGRIQAGETLQVSGLSMNPNAPTYDRLLDPFNRAIMDEMARRWGVAVNYIPDSSANQVELLVSGQAMIAIGVTPRWDGADRFDYSRPYGIRRDQLMVLEEGRYQQFADFRGGSVMGFWYENPEDRARIEEIAGALLVNATPYEFRSIEEIVDQFNNRNVDGIFGDSLRLIAIQDLSSTSGLPWKIVDEEYSRTPLTLALPRNDLKFRLLVDWTLQDMYFDGTYQQIYRDYFPGGGEPLVMLTWTGDGSWLLGE